MKRKMVIRIERGWAGHFCAASFCRFRRNTLLAYGQNRIIVSTVGNMVLPKTDSPTTIGWKRYYETMVFQAKKYGKYWDVDVTQQIIFDSNWSIDEPDDDNRADNMHEMAVAEITIMMLNNEIKYM